MKVDTMVQDLSTTAVVPALEANMLAFWATHGRAPGAELYEGEDLLRVVTGVSEPLFNGVFRTRLISDAVDSAIATTLAHVTSRRVPMFWWVGPWTRPADLGTHLERHGFTHAGNSPAMAVDLRTLPEEAPEIPGLAVAPVEDLEMLRTWGRVAAIGTGVPQTVPRGARCAGGRRGTRAARAPLQPLHRVPGRRCGGHFGIALARRSGRHLRRGYHRASTRTRHWDGPHAGAAPGGPATGISSRHPPIISDGLSRIQASRFPGSLRPDRDIPLESLAASREQTLRCLYLPRAAFTARQPPLRARGRLMVSPSVGIRTARLGGPCLTLTRV
jgi:hypothetical protein